MSEKMKSKKNIKTVIIFLIAIIMLVIIDQLTKYAAVINLKGNVPYVIIPGVFEFMYLQNESAAFSLDPISILHDIFHFQAFDNSPELFLAWKMGYFILFTAVVVLLLFVLYLKIPKEKRFRWLDIILLFLIAGAIGNFIDRTVQNYVVDFFYFKLINFPVFNVADIYVTCAAIAMVILGIFYYKEEDYQRIFDKKKKG